MGSGMRRYEINKILGFQENWEEEEERKQKKNTWTQDGEKCVRGRSRDIDGLRD